MLLSGRALNLLGLWLTASLRRLRYDWVRELVVFLCGGIFIALAVYLAHDFLNTELIGLSDKGLARMKKAASVVAWLALWSVAAKVLGREKTDPDSISNTALRLGETQRTVRQFQSLRFLCLVALVSTAFCFLTNRFLFQWEPQQLVYLSAGGVSLAVVLARVCRPKRREGNAVVAGAKASWVLSKSMMRWRIGQIVFRNRLTRLCLGFCAAGCALNLILAHRGAPFILLSLFSFLSGCFLAMCIAFQTQEDMKQAWFERHLGVSHHAYITALVKSALVLGLVPAVLLAAALMVVTPHASVDLIKVPISLLIPVLMMPYLVLQIDPYRPWIQAIMVVLLGIIIATASYAHWLGLATLFLFNYFAAQQCEGRYYRA